LSTLDEITISLKHCNPILMVNHIHLEN